MGCGGRGYLGSAVAVWGFVLVLSAIGESLSVQTEKVKSYTTYGPVYSCVHLGPCYEVRSAQYYKLGSSHHR